jgi:small conductance mechanosensitive channel
MQMILKNIQDLNLSKPAIILILILAAWIVHRLSGFLTRIVEKVFSLAPKGEIDADRRKTIRFLLRSAISFLAFFAAGVAIVGLFVSIDTLVWVVGLFSAAFGLAARPVISDVLTGFNFLFADTFSVGEKVEMTGIEGVVEAINLRTTFLRAPNGELYVIPNGEIRIVRNFSRGKYSQCNVVIRIASSDLGRALPLLDRLKSEAMLTMPDMIEPWKVISEGGVIGQQTELTILAKAMFGKAAEMKPHLLKLIQETFSAEGIGLMN